MKLRITLKDPDGVSNSIKEAVRASVANLELSRDELEELAESRQEEVGRALEKWFQYDEVVSIDIDTERGTAIVVERR